MRTPNPNVSMSNQSTDYCNLNIRTQNSLAFPMHKRSCERKKNVSRNKKRVFERELSIFFEIEKKYKLSN